MPAAATYKTEEAQGGSRRAAASDMVACHSQGRGGRCRSSSSSSSCSPVSVAEAMLRPDSTLSYMPMYKDTVQVWLATSSSTTFCSSPSPSPSSSSPDDSFVAYRGPSRREGKLRKRLDPEPTEDGGGDLAEADGLLWGKGGGVARSLFPNNSDDIGPTSVPRPINSGWHENVTGLPDPRSTRNVPTHGIGGGPPNAHKPAPHSTARPTAPTRRRRSRSSASGHPPRNAASVVLVERRRPSIGPDPSTKKGPSNTSKPTTGKHQQVNKPSVVAIFRRRRTTTGLCGSNRWGAPLRFFVFVARNQRRRTGTCSLLSHTKRLQEVERSGS
jgi:hypothetical protein